MFKCPICEGKKVGKISGAERYFCRDCCLEFSNSNGEVIVFKINENGNLCNIKIS